VQETGRGGRDGNDCMCVLFYRDQDVETAKKVLNINNSQGSVDDSMSKLEGVRRVSSSVFHLLTNIVAKSVVFVGIVCHGRKCMSLHFIVKGMRSTSQEIFMR
jgi:hypothetical protein